MNNILAFLFLTLTLCVTAPVFSQKLAANDDRSTLYDDNSKTIRQEKWQNITNAPQTQDHATQGTVVQGCTAPGCNAPGGCTAPGCTAQGCNTPGGCTAPGCTATGCGSCSGCQSGGCCQKGQQRFPPDTFDPYSR